MYKLTYLMIFGLFYNISQAQDSVLIITEPKIFAPNTISAGAFELNASFSTDESTVYFTKATTNWDLIGLFSSTLKNKKWQQPVLLPFSGKYRDADPFVSLDGKKMYFISDRPINGSEYKNFDYHIFYVELDYKKIISDPILVNLPLPEGMRPVYPSVSSNGNMYFAANKNGNNDIYVCELKENKYQLPKLLSFNSDSINDLDPVIAFDESFLIFASSNRKGYGSNDLYISFNKNGSWTNPLNLGSQINTKGSDIAPGLSRNNKTLYFTSYKEKLDRQAIDQKKMDFNKFSQLLNSYQNGIGNIYEIDISKLEIIKK